MGNDYHRDGRGYSPRHRRSYSRERSRRHSRSRSRSRSPQFRSQRRRDDRDDRVYMRDDYRDTRRIEGLSSFVPGGVINEAQQVPADTSNSVLQDPAYYPSYEHAPFSNAGPQQYAHIEPHQGFEPQQTRYDVYYQHSAGQDGDRYQPGPASYGYEDPQAPPLDFSDRYDPNADNRYDSESEDYERRSRGRYSSRYEQDLEAGLDGAVERNRIRGRSLSGRSASAGRSTDSDDEYEYRRGRRERPSSSIYVKGLPEDKDEADLWKLFEGYRNIKSIRILRDRSSNQSRGFAFVDFQTVEDAQVLMESQARWSLQVDGQRLHLEYSHTNGPPPNGSATFAVLDWICDMCGAVNFARRMECYQCSSVRPKNPTRVNTDPEGPSNILKVSGLEQQISEEILHYVFSAHAPIKDIRFVRDKFSGAPKGFAFVHFHNVVDAGKVMNLLQGQVISEQSTPIRLCYARDRLGFPPNSAAASLGADALEAAQAMQQYSAWEPKEFDENAIDPGKADTKTQATTSTTETTAPNPQAGGAPQSGFVYDSNSGYWYDTTSGYYYDANTGLYYDGNSQQWFSYNHSTGEYTVCTTGGTGQTGVSTAGQGAIAACEHRVAAVKAADQVSAATKTAPPDRKKGAIIGAAPQLNPQGVLAAALAAREKELQQRALAKQNQQNNAKQNQVKAGPTVSAQPRAQVHAAATHGPAPTAAPVAAGQPGAPVQGVIRRGKWSQKAATGAV